MRFARCSPAASPLKFDAMHASPARMHMRFSRTSLSAAKARYSTARRPPISAAITPDPNLVHAKELYDLMMSNNAPDFGAASDGDGDRNLIIGRGIARHTIGRIGDPRANAHLAPAYAGGISGVARSIPTSAASGSRRAKTGRGMFWEPPTGWKFFGNPVGRRPHHAVWRKIGRRRSNHVREKMACGRCCLWLNILAKTRVSVKELLEKSLGAVRSELHYTP